MRPAIQPWQLNSGGKCLNSISKMPDAWYYAEDGAPKGPMSLSDLLRALSVMHNARDAMVWRAGFQGWTKATDVSEIAEHIFNPPPPNSPSPAQKPASKPIPDILVSQRKSQTIAVPAGPFNFRPAIYKEAFLWWLAILFIRFLAEASPSTQLGRPHTAPLTYTAPTIRELSQPSPSPSQPFNWRLPEETAPTTPRIFRSPFQSTQPPQKQINDGSSTAR